MTCKDFYWLFIANKQPTVPTAVSRWTEEFNTIQLNWPNIFKLPFLSTIESKLQAFQYSILHRYVPHRKLLFRQGLVAAESCNFCTEQDTIVHRFWSCQQTRLFWAQVERWINMKTNIGIQLNCTDVMFGINMNANNDMLYMVNNILLNGKQFIHKMKYQERSPELHYFIKFLESKIKIEQHICNKNGKSHVFKNRWSMPFSNL